MRRRFTTSEEYAILAELSPIIESFTRNVSEGQKPQTLVRRWSLRQQLAKDMIPPIQQCH